MGKTKQSRRKQKSGNSRGYSSRQVEKLKSEVSGVNSLCPSDAALQNIVDQLQGQIEDKVFALHSLASIFQSPESVQEVVRRKVARIAGPLLLDPSSAVRNAAAGALRNVTSSGNSEICALLIDQDVMTPLAALLQKYTEEWQLTGKTSHSENADTFTQAVHLLWNLCEGNDRAVHYFNEGDLLSVLMKYITATPGNIQVALAVVQCLITVVEDNSRVCRALQKWEGQLYNIFSLKGDSPGLLLLQVLTAGVLLKLKSCQHDILNPVVLNAITSPLLHDQRLALHKLSSMESGELSDDQGALQDVSQLLEAQQIALELLTNLCADEDDAMEIDSSSASSEDLCDNGFSDTASDVTELNGSSVSLTPVLHEIIVSQQLVQKIWEKTQLPAENVNELLHEHSGGQHLLKRIVLLRSRAFLCLNNLVPVLDVQDLNGLQSIFQMWSEIATLVFKSEEQDMEVLEAASAAMRATLQKLAECPRDQSIEIQLPHIEFIFSAGRHADPQVRANIVKTVSVLGTMSMPLTSDHSLQVFKRVSTFLLDTCEQESELWVLAETLDSVMDLFGEDETDQISVDLKLVARLQAVLPAFQSKVRMNRRKLGGHYPLVSTVNINLPRFIQYKFRRLSART